MDAALVRKGGGGSDEQNYAVIIKIIMKHTYSTVSRKPQQIIISEITTAAVEGGVCASACNCTIYIIFAANTCTLYIIYYICMCLREYVCVSDIITC